jgi:hypothetical protein
MKSRFPANTLMSAKRCARGSTDELLASSASISSAAATPTWSSADRATASASIAWCAWPPASGCRATASARTPTRAFDAGPGQGRDAHPPLQATAEEPSVPPAKAASSRSVTVLRAPEGEDEIDGWDEAEFGGQPMSRPSGVVIAETQALLKTMTVSMAVMEMDLTESQAIVFRNAAHGGLSVVYRRPTGTSAGSTPKGPRRKPSSGASNALAR